MSQELKNGLNTQNDQTLGKTHCPICYENIYSHAIKCPHCQSYLPKPDAWWKSYLAKIQNQPTLFGFSNYLISLIAIIISFLALILSQVNLSTQKNYSIESEIFSKAIYLKLLVDRNEKLGNENKLSQWDKQRFVSECDSTRARLLSLLAMSQGVISDDIRLPMIMALVESPILIDNLMSSLDKLTLDFDINLSRNMISFNNCVKSSKISRDECLVQARKEIEKSLLLQNNLRGNKDLIIISILLIIGCYLIVKLAKTSIKLKNSNDLLKMYNSLNDAIIKINMKYDVLIDKLNDPDNDSSNPFKDIEEFIKSLSSQSISISKKKITYDNITMKLSGIKFEKYAKSVSRYGGPFQ